MNTTDNLPQTITIPSRISNDQFGASAKFFNAHVKGQDFEVITRSQCGQFVYFYVNGEQFGVHVSDLVTDDEYRTKKAIDAVNWEADKLEKEAA